MQKVSWKIIYNDDSGLEEIDFYNKVSAFPVETKNIANLSLFCENGAVFGFDLRTGNFISCGVPIGIYIPADKRMYEINQSNFKPLAVYQYKEAILEQFQTEYEASYHYLRYEADISYLNIESKKVIVTLRVDAETFLPALSVELG